MGKKTTTKSSQHSLDSLMEFEDHELRDTMREFLEEEKKANTNIWNFATIAGIAMFFVGMLYLIQMVGLGFGPDLSELVELMPLVGGVLVTLVGFGFLVGERSKSKNKQHKKSGPMNFDFGYDYDEDEDSEFNLDNDLGGSSSSKSKTKTDKYQFDSYALKQPKKLYKSRTDRKWSGVCGGLAKYFGISSTVIRLLFVITFFAGSGTSLLVYIALAIALDKEPPELMDDFDY